MAPLLVLLRVEPLLRVLARRCRRPLAAASWVTSSCGGGEGKGQTVGPMCCLQTGESTMGCVECGTHGGCEFQKTMLHVPASLGLPPCACQLLWIVFPSSFLLLAACFLHLAACTLLTWIRRSRVSSRAATGGRARGSSSQQEVMRDASPGGMSAGSGGRCWLMATATMI